jgi:alpha-tubulin suppressor-like RCC1 family protein
MGWGKNGMGQLAMENQNDVLSPQHINSLDFYLTKIVKISTGGWHCFALLGKVYLVY